MSRKFFAFLTIVAALTLVLVPGFMTDSTIGILLGITGLILSVVYYYTSNYEDDELDWYKKDMGLSAPFFVITSIVVWWSPLPIIHEVLYSVLFKFPVLLQFIVTVALFAGAVYLYQNSPDKELIQNLSGLLGVIAIIAIILTMVGIGLHGSFVKTNVAQDVSNSAMELETLPESSIDNSRIMPRAVAENLASNSLQYPQYSMSNGDITFLNGTPHWSWSLSPSGGAGRNKFALKQTGAVFINQSTINKDMSVIDDKNMEIGNGMAVTDNVYWQLKKDDYWVSYQDSFVVPHEDEMYIAVPYIEHEHNFRFPAFYSTPEFGGVKLVSEDGNIEDLTPEEALENEVLEGQNIYPYDLARFEVASMGFEKGIYNAYLVNEDQIQVPKVPGQGNTQPYTVPTEDGIKYFVSAEPVGSGTNSVTEVWVIDARTGEKTYVDFSETFRGARKSVQTVTDTQTVKRMGQGVEGVEPIPMVIDGKLYWNIKVVPSSSSQINYVVFYDPKTDNDITFLNKESEIRRFMSEGEDFTEVPSDSEIEDVQESEGNTLTIIIEKNNGETEEITVEEGSVIRIENPNSGD